MVIRPAWDLEGASCYCVTPTVRAQQVHGQALIRPHEVDRLVRALLVHAGGRLEPFMRFVARYVATVPFVDDPQGCDRWCSPSATIARWAGDCDDHAVLATSMLLGGGIDAAMVVGTFRGEGHAWVEGVDARGWFLLESTSGQIFRGMAREAFGYEHTHLIAYPGSAFERFMRNAA